jgi:quercetin dioxygenase-like cupin family protein
MRSIPRQLAVAALVGFFFVTWKTQTDEDVLVAQTRKPIMATRIYTGPDGQSHSQEIEMRLTDGATEMIKATGVQFRRTPPGNFSDWHVGPRRQYVITLSGRGEIELAGGRKVFMGPGHINLIEDLTGKGHTTRVTGTEDRVTIAIPLADQSVSTSSR